MGGEYEGTLLGKLWEVNMRALRLDLWLNMSHYVAADIVSLATTHVSPTLRSTG